jgi:hypothetical protein
MRDLGTMGETLFEHLCSLGRIHFNKSIRDRTGWDYFIEFPLETHLQLPIDLLPPPIVALVQVKATDGTAGDVRLKLHNLLRLINNPLPAFVVLFDFFGKETAQRAYVIHLGEMIIERTLRRIREIEASGSRRINRNVLTIKLNEDDALDDVSSTHLFQKIRSQIIPSFPDYVRWKRDTVARIGFIDNNFGTFKFSFSSEEDSFTDFVDLMLGIRPDLDIANIEMMSTRFGIDLPMPPPANSAKLSVETSPDGSCSVGFSCNAQNSVCLDGKYFLPGIPDLPIRYHKIRILAEPFDITIASNDKSGGKVKLNFSAMTRLDLHSLLSIFRVMDWLYHDDLEVSVCINSVKTFRSKAMHMRVENSEYWRRGARCVDSLLKICEAFNLRSALSVEDVFSQLQNFETIARVYSGDFGVFKAEFPPNVVLSAEAIQNKEIGVVFAAPVRVADDYLVLFIAQRGTAISVENNIIIAKSSRGKAVSARIFPGGVEDTCNLINE